MREGEVIIICHCKERTNGFGQKCVRSREKRKIKQKEEEAKRKKEHQEGV